MKGCGLDYSKKPPFSTMVGWYLNLRTAQKLRLSFKARPFFAPLHPIICEDAHPPPKSEHPSYKSLARVWQEAQLIVRVVHFSVIELYCVKRKVAENPVNRRF